MSYLELRQLWKLHEVDLALLEIKKKAAALDPGRAIQAQLAQILSAAATVGAEFKRLSGEQSDSELQRQGAMDKAKKLESDLFGGKVVNPREVETMQREIDNLRRKANDLDNRTLELMEAIPPIEAKVKRAAQLEAAKKAELAEFQKSVLQEKAKLEADFKALSAQRGPLAKEMNPSLVARYDAIRQKHGGIGMVRANKKACGECGCHLPEKLLEAAREGRVVTCEACHRILYVSDGLI